MNTIRRLLLLLLIAGLASCDDGGSSGGGGALAGSSWRLSGWSASSLDPADFTITATFDDREVGGTSAVNQYGGTYTAKGGNFSTGAISMTEMAGPEPAMRAEQIYLTLLAQARKYDRTAGRLVLLDASGNELLVFTARAN